MFVAGGNPGAANNFIVAQTTRGGTELIPGNPTGIGLPGHTLLAGDDVLIVQAYRAQRHIVGAQQRWRASKGSAPVNRFTRSFGNNQTEGWHLSMPVGIETIVTVLVPAVFLRMLSVAPAVVPGAAPVTAPPTTIRLIANAPAVSQATQVAVPTSRITLNAIAPARTTTRTLTVPAVAVRDIALAPTVVPGTRTLTPQIGVLRLLAVAPQVQNFILVPAATLRLLAVAPSVTGGGGGGGTVTLRKSGD